MASTDVKVVERRRIERRGLVNKIVMRDSGVVLVLIAYISSVMDSGVNAESRVEIVDAEACWVTTML